MATYTHIIFDLDDTLLDFQYTQQSALRKIVQEYQLPDTKKTTNLYKEINTSLWKEMEKGHITRQDIFSRRFETFLNQFGIEVNGEEVDGKYKSYLESGFQTIEQAQDVLSSLKEAGVHLLAGTNGVGTIQRKRLVGSKLNTYFESLFISEELGFEKPDKRFFDRIFEKTNESDPSKYLMVGDSLTADIQGAKNSGIDSVWFQPNQVAPIFKGIKSTYTIHSLDQLFPIIGIPVPQSIEMR